jgi:hypothetical protein
LKITMHVGLDVHADTIAVAVAEMNGEVRSLGVIPNCREAVGKLVKKLGHVEQPLGVAPELPWERWREDSPLFACHRSKVPLVIS